MPEEINIAGLINQEADWLTAQEKQEMLSYFCLDKQYPETVDDGQGGQIPNPQSKASFFNRNIAKYIRKAVREGRRKEAANAIVVEELDL